MIKLIASDMDGTLLDEDGRLPEETFQLIEELREVGISFATSTGRRFDTLQELFAPVVDHMDFVASNGAQVVVDGVLIDREVFSHASLQRLLRTIGMFDNLHLALFDRTNSYLFDDESCFERELDKNLPNPVRTERLPSAEISILKASLYCDEDVMDTSYALSRELGEDFVFAPSGNKWIDVMQRGVSKATGIRQVMDARGVSADEVIAFGDSMNDYEIMRMVGTSVAMDNARPAIKKIASRQIGTNADHSVQREMRRILEDTRR